jgi:hypothetical protein
VSWNQALLTETAHRIAASGERVEGYATPVALTSQAIFTICKLFSTLKKQLARGIQRMISMPSSRQYHALAFRETAAASAVQEH